MDKKYFSYPRMIFFFSRIYTFFAEIYSFSIVIYFHQEQISLRKKYAKKKQTLFFKYLSLHSSCGIEKNTFSFDSTIVHLMKFSGHVTNKTELKKADGKQKFQVIESINIK